MAPGVVVRAAAEADWPAFLGWAQVEQWQVPDWEPGFYASSPAATALAAQAGDELAGIVSGVNYQASAWIGNLLVPPHWRGRGVGRRLFEAVLERLLERGATSVWLTASQQGSPLYEQYGFRPIDVVRRWVLAPSTATEAEAPQGRCAELLAADHRAWGESRGVFLEARCRAGEVFAAGETLLLRQPLTADLTLLGPWYSPSLCPRENRLVLGAALAGVSGTLSVDLLASAPVAMMLQAAGFSPVGENLLMARGSIEAVDRSQLFALASPGSLG